MKQLVTSSQVLGVAIKRARKLKKLTQTQAGKKVGIEQSTVSSIEHGAPGTQIETIFRMLAALGLEMVIQEQPQLDDVKSEWEW